MTNTRKRVLRTLLTLLITPFALVLVLGILLYLPPIQRWAVRQAASYLSSQTGIEVTLDRVHLSFPLECVPCRMATHCWPSTACLWIWT